MVSRFDEKSEWMDDARCESTPTDMFFEPKKYDITNTDLIEFCQGCPVKLMCLAAALEEEKGAGAGFVFGIRGGMNPTSRRSLNKKLRKKND